MVQHKLADSSTLLSVPGIIAGESKDKNCKFKTFEDFALTVLKEVNKDASFGKVEDKISVLKEEISKIPEIEGRIINFIQSSQE